MKNKDWEYYEEKMKNKNQSQSIRDKIKVAPYSASLSQNGASDTQNHAESDVKVSMATAHASGSAPSGDEEILKEVLNFGYYDSYDSNKFSGYELREYIKKAIQLKGQADDRKFEDWKKRLKEEIKKGKCPDCDLKVGKCKCSYKKLFVTIDRRFIDKLSGGLE